MTEVSMPKHLIYRCYKCGAVITKYQVMDKWASAPPDPEPGQSVPLCSCGSSHISPGNAKWWEEVFFPACWKVIWNDVILPWWRNRK